MIAEKYIAMMRYFNPWWEGAVQQVPQYHRHVFEKIEKYMKTKQVIAIIGLRRVGKTILMRQVMSELIGKGTEPKNVFYFLFDDLLTQNPDMLEDIFDYYLKSISKEGTKYIFLDEIQKVQYWQDIVKRHYDTRDDIKFVVSGSASLNIKKSKESLAGRIYDFYVPVLTFREFLELNDLKFSRVALNYRHLKEPYENNLHKKPQMMNLLEQYIEHGAFPEIAKESDRDIIYSYIRNSVTDKIVYEDIPTAFKITRKDVLYSMLEYCARETSSLLEVKNLAGTLGVNYLTARTYLFYLEHSFLITLIYNNSKNIAKQLRKNKKIHIAHPSISLALARSPHHVLGRPEEAGKYIETIIAVHVNQLSDKITFWRSPQKEEVDIVADMDKTTIPIEVKFQSSINSEDVNSLIKFMDRKSLSSGIVITRDDFKEIKREGKTILFVPAWLFLLAV